MYLISLWCLKDNKFVEFKCLHNISLVTFGNFPGQPFPCPWQCKNAMVSLSKIWGLNLTTWTKTIWTIGWAPVATALNTYTSPPPPPWVRVVGGGGSTPPPLLLFKLVLKRKRLRWYLFSCVNLKFNIWIWNFCLPFCLNAISE